MENGVSSFGSGLMVPQMMNETTEDLLARIVLDEHGAVRVEKLDGADGAELMVVVEFGDRRHGTRLDMDRTDCFKRALADAILWNLRYQLLGRDGI